LHDTRTVGNEHRPGQVGQDVVALQRVQIGQRVLQRGAAAEQAQRQRS
jgi:hypothetical protein